MNIKIVSILEHILEHTTRIKNICSRVDNNKDLILNDYLYYDAIFMNIIQIGENAKLLPECYVKCTDIDIPWNKIRGFRNRIVHEYNKVDFDIFWKVVSEEITKLHYFVSTKLDEYNMVINTVVEYSDEVDNSNVDVLSFLRSEATLQGYDIKDK